MMPDPTTHATPPDSRLAYRSRGTAKAPLRLGLHLKALLERLLPLGIMTGLFVIASLAFFMINGREPWTLFMQMLEGAFGDFYSLSESLVQAAPIMLTALAVAVPARLGLISVGGEGQMYFGAIVGTGVVLVGIDLPALLLMPAMLLGGMLGGALWGLIPALLKTRLGINETIATLLLNYIALLLVSFLVHGPWRNPASLGWPSTVSFPSGAILPTFFDSRIHLGLLLAIGLAIFLHWVVTYSRWGLTLQVLRNNARAGTSVGLRYSRHVVLVMCIGGLLAGIAGIAEASVIQGRLQTGIAGTFGLTGFLVAWLAGQHFLRIIPISILMGGLLASADTLQMFAQLPSASAVILQAVLFTIVLAVNAYGSRHWRAAK